MTHLKLTRAAASALALMAGGAAMADVTAPEVWENWKESIALAGEDGLSAGSEDYAGGTLTVTDVAMNFSDPETTLTAEIGTIVFEEQGDGTVRITMPESYPMMIEDDGAVVTLDVQSSEAELIASGTPDAITYDVNAAQYAIVLADVQDPSGEAPTGEARFAMNDVSGTFSSTSGDISEMSYNLSTASIDILMDLADNLGTDVMLSGKIDGLAIDATIAVPEGMDFEDENADVFGEGFAVAANYGYSGSGYMFEVNEEGNATQGSAETGGAEVSVVLNGDQLVYDVGVDDVSFQLQSQEMPLPVDISLARYGIVVSAPLAATEEATDFRLGVDLTDMVINDELWMLVDPEGQLARGPLTARLALSGMGKLFFDILDPAQQQAMEMADLPGEIETLQLDELTLRAAGAEVDGTGSFTFDNSDLQTFPGVPRPEGQITIDLRGANALIDNLVAMGLLPEDQAMMGRMMMGMFAQSTGDDQLRSVIEVNEQGHVLANGQRLQ